MWVNPLVCDSEQFLDLIFIKVKCFKLGCNDYYEINKHTLYNGNNPFRNKFKYDHFLHLSKRF